MDPAPENINNPNYTYPSFPSVSKKYDNISEEVSSPNTSDIGAEVIYVADLVICVFGAVGNGMVIWLLGFRIKRNPFSTFILNLATADLGVLLSAILEISLYLLSSAFDSVVTLYLFLSMYSTSQFLLTAISIDSVNPVIYFLVGRRWKSRRRENLKMILQKVFKEEEGCTEETPAETQL
ncbi:UNVERIFIED_CONTAM: hypothetical protein K2H54_013345 [Gekko kuhli]